MSKRGFTLIELLITIAVLAIIMTIAVPTIGAITQNIKDNMLEKKANLIEEAAILLGEDIKGSIIGSKSRYNGYACRSFIVSDLVPTYLDKDNDNECLNNESTNTVGCIVDPRDDSNYLDKYQVIIYYRSKRMYAMVDTDNSVECS